MKNNKFCINKYFEVETKTDCKGKTAKHRKQKRVASQ